MEVGGASKNTLSGTASKMEPFGALGKGGAAKLGKAYTDAV